MPTAADYDDGFGVMAGSHWMRTVFPATLDPDLPAEVEPFSFVPLAGLAELAGALAAGPGATVVDLACGRGGPGMWVARATGAALVGVDWSAVGVAHATARVDAFGLTGRARFTVGDLAATGLPDGCADAAMCVDAFQFAPDPVAAAREAYRIVRAGGRFALTCWEARERGDPAVPDRFRDLDLAGALSTAGFTAVDVRERPDWETRLTAVFAAALAAPEDPDDKGLAILREEAAASKPWRDRVRRVLVAAAHP